MHRAAYCGHGDVVRVLVREGAEGGRTDSDGKTPLHKVRKYNMYIIMGHAGTNYLFVLLVEVLPL